MLGLVPETGTRVRTGTRILYYCHDTFGLGHIRRTLTLANHLHNKMPGVSQLVVTGSPVAHGFRLPPGTDYVKLPSVTKDERGSYEPHSLSCSLASVRDMRSDILLSAAHHFQPDHLIIDHAPGGFNGEALATLHHFRESFPETRLVLGLRDVIDEPEVVRQAWERDGTYRLLDEVYDQILVYGMASMNDIVRQYGMSARATNRTRYVGYLRRESSTASRETVRSRSPLVSDRMVVVTAGGGKDGRAIFDAAIGAARAASGTYDTVLVGGPLLTGADRRALRGAVAGVAGVHLLDDTDDMMGWFAAADAVVSMGGYNSVCEILSAGVPALIVPRVHPRREQLIRATFLSERGAVGMLHPDDLSADTIRTAIRSMLYRRDRPSSVPMTGLDGFLRALSEDPAAPSVDWRFAASTRLPVVADPAAATATSTTAPVRISRHAGFDAEAAGWA